MTVYYVSPTGNDASSGISPNSAFATLGAAVKAMAATGTADTAYVLDGTYYLNGKGLSLTSANSNDTISAYQDANPVISGGSAVPSTGWSVGANGTWSIQLNTNDVEQFTVNGQSQTLARYPNEVPSDPIKGGWLWAQALPAGYNPSNQIAYNPADFPAGQPPTVGEKVSIFDAANWSSNLLTISAVDTSKHIITFAESSWFNLGPGSRYFVSGAQPLLDQPGEWYFNQATHTLYYHPPAGFTGSGGVVSGDTSIINISNAQNITIHGLSFADAATKAAVDYITTAAVSINSSTGVVVDGNNFSNVAQGVFLTGSSSHNTVSNNTFSNTWGAAIEVSGGTSQNLITQNSIQNTNTVFATSGAIQLENTWNNTISYNSIHDVPRSGITDFQMSGSSGANLIEYNTVVNSGLKGNDLGAIYAYAGSNRSALGDTVAYNTIISPGGLGTTSSGFISGDYWSAGIYMDDGTGNAQIYGNFISGGTYGGIFLAGGDNNHVWNNIITGTHQAAGGGLGYGILLGSFANTTPMAGTEVHDNIIQIPTGASAISFQNGIVNPSAIYSNIYYGSSSSALQIANMSLSQFQAKGGDQGSTFTTDPGFTDAANGNYSLHSGSYALTHGFQDLPWAQMGVQNQASPDAPTIVSFSTDSGVVGDRITNDNTLTLTGTAEANATVKIYDGTTLLNSVTANSSGAWSYTTAALSNGAHSLTATATDVAGNTGAASSALAVTIDTGAPSAPSITSFSTDSGVVGDRITNDNTLTLTGTAEANATVKIYDGTTLLNSVTASGTGAWSYTTPALSNGAHSLTATATDLAGNTGATSVALSVTIDTGAPSAPSISSFSVDSGVAGDRITNDNTLTLTGTAEANATVKVYDGATLLNSVTANSSGAWSYITAALSNGAHSLTATATDVAGNTGVASTALAVTIDTTTPIVAQTAANPSNGIELPGDTVMLTLTLSEAVTVTGTPVLALNSGGTASYSGGSGSNTLTFSYTVGVNDSGVSALAVTAINLLNGATITDAAGNAANLSAALVTFSNLQIDPPAAPQIPTIAAFSTDSGVVGDRITNDNTLTLTGKAEANSTVTVYDGETLLGSVKANSKGTWNYTTAPLTDGAHSLSATATDAAGNTGVASTALSVTIDTTAPVVPTIVSFSTDSGVVGDSITKDNTLTLIGTAEANSTVRIYDGSKLLGKTTTSANGDWSYTTAALGNGRHNLTATATDAAGNTSAAVTAASPTSTFALATTSALAVTIDAIAPVAPTIASFSTDSGVVGDRITNDNTLTLTGKTEANSTVKVYDGAMLLGSATANGSGAWSYTTPALANGAHSLIATATDTAGNTGVASTALSVTIDTTAPLAPTIASFSTDSGVVGDHITNDNTLTLTGTAEANSTIKLYDGDTLLGSVKANSTGAWSYTTPALANGAHSLTATATDVAGNTGVVSSALAVTIIVPTITAFSTDSGVVGDRITNDNKLALTGTAEVGSTVKVYDGTKLLGSTTTDGSGDWSFTTAALGNGRHNLTVRDTDATGITSSPSSALVVTIDTTAPVAPTIASFSTDSGVVGDRITNDNTLTLTGKAEANSTVKVYDGATLLDSATANGSGVWSYTTAALADGAHSLIATATDAAGNTGVASTARSVTIDTTAPLAPTIASFSTDSGVVGDHITNDSTPTFTGTAEANSTIKLYDGDTLLGSVKANSSGAWSYTTPALANGAHSLTATATDVAGNTGVASNALALTIDPLAPAAPIALHSDSASNIFEFSGGMGKHKDFNHTQELVQSKHDAFAALEDDGAHFVPVGSDLVIGADAHSSIALHTVHAHLTHTFHLV